MNKASMYCYTDIFIKKQSSFGKLYSSNVHLDLFLKNNSRFT